MSIAAKKVLVPLTVLLAAGALAVGSGATFSSEATNNTLSTVTSGTVKQTNSKNGVEIFGLNTLKPGDTLRGSVTITNTGTLPALFKLTESSSTNGFSDENLKLDITTTTGVKVWDGKFGALKDAGEQALGKFAPGDANTYVFTVTLDANTPNTDQNKTASAAYSWTSTQTDGEQLPAQ